MDNQDKSFKADVDSLKSKDAVESERKEVDNMPITLESELKVAQSNYSLQRTDFDESVENIMEWLRLPKSEKAANSSNLLPSFSHSNSRTEKLLINDVICLSPEEIKENEDFIKENTAK